MSMDELTQTEMGRVIKDAGTASALQMCPDFIERLPVAIYACDMQGRIIWFNARAVALWGRTPRAGDVERFCGAYWFERRQITPEGTPTSTVLKTGIPIYGVEGLVERPDGSRIWTMAHIEPVKDESGRIVGAINCFHETTELHLATETIEDLFQNAIMALHLVSADGTILRANAKELQMLGYLPDEYIGRNIAEFHADQTAIADMLERLARNEQLVQYPARLRAKDGSIRHVLVSSNARFREGEFVNTRCFTVDITERLQAEERGRRQEEQRLAATYQYAPIGIAEVDADGKLLRANAQSCGLLGYSSDEVLGRSIFEGTVDQSSEADREQFRRQIAGELDRYTIERPIRRKDGSHVWVSVTSSSVRDSDGGFLYAVRVEQDITERKLREEEREEREEKERLLLREVNHRAKNILSVVDAIAHQTATKNPEDFIERFSERIQALSANQDLLVRNEWKGVEIEDLARAQLSHFADLIGSRIAVHGPKLRLKATGAQAVGLALHELATNAGKYGALSTDTGRVDIRWGTNGDTLTMSWIEREGPPVSAPKRCGFGTIVMETMAKRSMGGAVDLDYAPSGLTWRLTCPAANALEGREREQSLQEAEIEPAPPLEVEVRTTV
jgi:PAS domain S-box-containing protein